MYNMLSPLEEPTESWLSLFQGMLYETETDYQNAFSRLNGFSAYVSISDHRPTLNQTEVTVNILNLIY